MPDKKNKAKGKTISNKAVRKNSVSDTQTQTQSSSKRQRSASVQDVPDEEPAHRGQVLNDNTDAILEEVGPQAADGPINVTDNESEDDEEKLREQSKAGSYNATS